MKWLLVVLAVIIGTMALVCGGCIVAGMSMFERAKAERDRIESLKTPEQKAKELAIHKLDTELFALKRRTREVMLDRLKAPDGAKIDVEITHVKGLIAYAQGNITSQNEFGAKLTKPVRVTWTRTSAKESFDLSAIEFEGQDFRNKDAMQAALAAVEALNVDLSKKP